MRPRVIVVVKKQLQDTDARLRRGRASHPVALVIDRLNEPLYFAIRLWTAGTNQSVFDASTLQGLFEPRQAVRVKGIAHRKHQVVVSHHGIDPIRQLPQHVLKKASRPRCCVPRQSERGPLD